MVLLSYLVWALRTLAGTPAAWLVGVAATLAWPAWLVLAPRGIALKDGYDAGALYEFAFLGLLAGAGLAVVINARGTWILSQLTPPQRNGAEASLLLATTAFGGALVLLPSTLPGTAAIDGAPLRASLVAAAHVAALAFLISRLTSQPGLRLTLLVSGGWVIPAILRGTGPLGQSIASALDASAVLARESAPLETPTLVLADVTPVAAGVLAAWLLDRPRTPRQ